MKPASLIVLALISLGFAHQPSEVPPRVALFHALPDDGVWVELLFKQVGPGRVEDEGSLRLATVGTRVQAGKTQRWVEVKYASKLQRKVRKVLIDQDALARGDLLEDAILEGFQLDQQTGNIARWTGPQLRDFVSLGLSGAKPVVAKELATLKTPLTQCTSRVLTAEARPAQDRLLKFQGWLTPDVPFGQAKFLVTSHRPDGTTLLRFEAEAARQGKDARSEVETK